ncbi:MAG: GNAT family N-acetyltransferase [Planctomycetes bacterium]|nr:GNAT family N-acetyltransferase [Planctomycetota bacterium]
MATTSIANPVAYYKRYRMEMDLTGPLPPVPALPDGFSWVAWEDRLLETHADVQAQCFRDDLDGIVFPNLANRIGCERLMRDIVGRSGFRPQATWLIAHGSTYVAMVQGVADRVGTGGIQNLGVIPAYRGQRLGWAILLKALHGFRQSGLAKAGLEVTAENEPAVRMYRQAGFRFRKTIYKAVEPATYQLVEPDWML